MLIPVDHENDHASLSQGFRLTAQVKGRDRRLRLLDTVSKIARHYDGGFKLDNVGTLVFLEHEHPEAVVYARMYLDSICGAGTASIGQIGRQRTSTVRELARRSTQSPPGSFHQLSGLQN